MLKRLERVKICKIIFGTRSKIRRNTERIFREHYVSCEVYSKRKQRECVKIKLTVPNNIIRVIFRLRAGKRVAWRIQNYLSHVFNF